MPAVLRALSGHYRRQPVLCRGFIGVNRSYSGFDRDSAGLVTGFNRGGTGKLCDRVKNPTNHPSFRRSTGVSNPGWTRAQPAKVRLALNAIIRLTHMF
ncbi:hypothetical protein DPMN_047165 [Dreissena polymorpha]|uniref:Uncharacterized protein n=1 Tax=Dreissena polymorpha TaxID=45954 RepID=A0A9D4D973_DREPO|nr:hypothetical protein DPMN_047165 [Dreissena polymorpha]